MKALSNQILTAPATPLVRMARILGGGLLGTSLLVTSLLTGAKPASADTAVIPFGGSLAGGCFFGTVTAGSLTFAGSPPTTVNGSSGSTTLTCTAGGNLSVAAPVTTAQHTGTLSSSGTLTATVTNATLGTITSGGTSSVAVSQSPTPYTLAVSMLHNNGSTPLAPGVYSYTVTLTATP